MLLVTPRTGQKRPAALVIESGILWNRPGFVQVEGDILIGRLPNRTIYAYGTKERIFEPYVAAQTPYLVMSLDSAAGVSTGKRRTIGEIQTIVQRRKIDYASRIARFGSLDYWRGRIWAPMNFLVYLGLRRYDLPQARADLANKSKELLLKEWLAHGHVHENYNANTGEGCDKPNSDRFYHWGGLLGLVAFIEEEYLEGPEKPIGV